MTEIYWYQTDVAGGSKFDGQNIQFLNFTIIVLYCNFLGRRKVEGDISVELQDLIKWELIWMKHV